MIMMLRRWNKKNHHLVANPSTIATRVEIESGLLQNELTYSCSATASFSSIYCIKAVDRRQLSSFALLPVVSAQNSK
jgi:hypothetical protein